MRRRQFITLLGGAAAGPMVLKPRPTHAQQPAMPVIGYLNSSSPDPSGYRVRAFQQGLSENSYDEGKTAAIEYRWADGHNDQLAALAADLIRRQVAVIATGSVPAALAAKAATSTTPIVFIAATDPVEVGLVASLNRPGGNATGVSTLNVELGPKRLELIHELVPKANIIALLVNPANPLTEPHVKSLQAAARTLGLQPHILHASTEGDLNTAFATMVQLRAAALVIGSDGFFTNRSERLAALALRHAVPTIFQYREFAVAGGLMNYGASIADAYRLAGAYTGRILTGEKPADLPVQQATKVELVVNMKTAKALGITVPLPLLARADEVIE